MMDKRQKLAKGKGKAKQVEDSADEDEGAEDGEGFGGELERFDDDDDDEDESGGEDEDDDYAAAAPPQLGKKTTYLDDDLFAEAAAQYEQAEDAADEDDEDAVEAAIEARRARKQAQRDAVVKEGGKRQVGDITLQHVSTSTGPALTSAAHPSATSATKFLSDRLYSKKRQVAVLASSVPQPNQERNPKKQKKGGLSLETRLLLGLDEPEDAEKEKQREKKKKRSLLLQAEGQRKAPASRPVSALRRGAKPAANFARSSFKG
ncbi:hypothetical protein JCM10212_006791 [Sporobolomyces blumeae]